MRRHAILSRMATSSKRASRLSIYRHWLEVPVLILTFTLLLGVPLLLGGLNTSIQIITDTPDENERTILVILLTALLMLFIVAGTVGVIFMMLWSARRRLHQLRRGAVRIGPTQFPAIDAEARAVRTALAVTKAVDLYLVDGRWLTRGIAPISVLGVTKPYAIVLDASLVQEMTLAELRFLLGVEYGHVQLGHVRVLTMIDAVSGSLGRIPFVGGFVRVLFSSWSNLAIYSADRAGLVASGSLASAYSALGKLAVGGAFWGEIDHTTLARQARRQRGRVFDLGNRLTSPFDTQPMGRFQRLVAFSDTPAFQSLCPGADLDFPAAEVWRQRIAANADAQ